jgi:Tfp pilus assembly protein FimT
MKKNFLRCCFKLLPLKKKLNLKRLSFLKNNAGFSLVELVAVAAIIVLMLGIIFTNWRSGSKDLLLSRAAHKLAQDIRRAGEMAMSAKEFQGQVPPGGYGIYLTANSGSYILYADSNGNEKYDDSASGVSDGKVETINFENDVFIQAISQGNLSNLSINFKPPIPKIKIKADSSEPTEAEITLSLQSNPTKRKVVKVNTAGLIEVE